MNAPIDRGVLCQPACRRCRHNAHIPPCFSLRLHGRIAVPACRRQLPAQTGQPLRCAPVRAPMRALQMWPQLHCHQTFLRLPGCDHSWGQSAVERRVPFGGDFRLGCCKIVEACQHFFVRAVWAAAAVCTGGNDGLKAVALFAAPPRLAVACGCDLLRGQSAVARCVPLRGQRGLLRSEVIEARQDLLPGADRAARSGCVCASRLLRASGGRVRISTRLFSPSPAARPAGADSRFAQRPTALQAPDRPTRGRFRRAGAVFRHRPGSRSPPCGTG